jgi:maltooligosyltrehalose trehalohydrolase
MEKDGGGWWRVDVDAQAGMDYAFCIDGGPPRPDPRSAWQPHGSDGPSRTVDHAAFVWTDHAFQQRPLSSGILYELHIGAFTPEGTFDAAIAKLAHLQELGATHVELMPVTDSPGAFCWGYDNVNLFAVRHGYGGPEGLKRFVDACHARGMAVIIDVVYNHIGPRSNYLPEFGPYFSEEHITKWGAGFNLDRRDSDEVRRFCCDNAIMWLRDYHCDGLRVDAVDFILDTRAVHLLEQLNAEVKHLEAQLGRHFYVIGESSANNPRVVEPLEHHGMGFDAHWANDFQHAVHALLTGERMEYYKSYGAVADLAAAAASPYVFQDRYAPHLGHHYGRAPHGLPARRFVQFYSNHDHVGNRRDAARFAQTAGLAKARIAAALLLTSPMVPMLFMGDEWGAQTPFYFFVDHREAPEIAQQTRAGRVDEFPEIFRSIDDVRDPADFETFAASKLDWEEADLPQQAALLEWHRRLIALRMRLSRIVDMPLSRTRVEFDEAAQWLCIDRGEAVIVCNFSAQAQAVPLSDANTMTIALASSDAVQLASGRITLPPESVAILGPSRKGETPWA